MQPTHTAILLEILEVIKYQNSKEKFVKEFEALNQIDAMAYVIEKLPQDVQEKIKMCNSDVEQMKQYISTEEYVDAYIKVSRDALQEFLIAVSPVLNGEQKEKIAQLATLH